MKQEELYKSRHDKESHHYRDEENEDFTHNARTHVHKHAHQRQNEKNERSHHESKKDKSKPKMKSDISHSCSKSTPSEVSANGFRNTDSCTNSSDDGANLNDKPKKKHKHKRKRKHTDESFKALSDRKKMIELELQALDAEEAAQAERRKKMRIASQHCKESEIKPTEIKEEPVSDNEKVIHGKREHSETHFSHAKQNSICDDDRRKRRSNLDQENRTVKIKHEHSAIEKSRKHNSDHRASSVKVKKESSGDSENSHSHRRVESRSSNRIKQEPDMSPHSHRRQHSKFGGNSTTTSDAENMEWGRSDQNRPVKKEKEVKEKEKPNFETSGKLAEDTNTFNGVVIKYNEPAEACKPRRRWRLYPFKGNDSLPFIPIHRQSAYLLGRSRLIADIPIDHPSCSKQHAVLQFRLTPYTREDGTKGRSVRPYIIDLGSSNGTFVNNKQLEPQRYMELFERDVLKFGFSSRVYVILHEESRGEVEEEDTGQIEESPS